MNISDLLPKNRVTKVKVWAEEDITSALFQRENGV
jgi:hypothetical protein